VIVLFALRWVFLVILLAAVAWLGWMALADDRS
jgi:hypothetical protein